jgi:hypothetical protein
MLAMQFLQVQGKSKEYAGVTVALALVVTVAYWLASFLETKEVTQEVGPLAADSLAAQDS